MFHFSFNLHAKVWKINIEKLIFWQFSSFSKMPKNEDFLPPYKDKKEEIWPSPMTKAPTPTEMSKGQSDKTNNATKKVKTAIADRLRTVS